MAGRFKCPEASESLLQGLDNGQTGALFVPIIISAYLKLLEVFVELWGYTYDIQFKSPDSLELGYPPLDSHPALYYFGVILPSYPKNKKKSA